MVHFLKQRTKHLTIQILGILTVHVADVIELLEMQREREKERENCTGLMLTFFWISKFDKCVKSFRDHSAV